MSNIEKVEHHSLAPAPMPVAQMMQMMIEKGITSENVLALEQLVKLQERLMDKDAEKQFASAFVALQAEMPKVEATRPVPNKDGSIRYHFAPFEEIMRQVGPFLKKHGFTVTFSTDYSAPTSATGPSRLIKSCTLQHTGGHSRTNTFAVRVGNGPPGSSEAQGDGAASTYAKRFALMDCLNIVCIGLDDDARAEGGEITPEQARSLFERVTALKLPIERARKFIEWGGGSVKLAPDNTVGLASYFTIPSGKVAMLETFLTTLERSPKGTVPT